MLRPRRNQAKPSGFTGLSLMLKVEKSIILFDGYFVFQPTPFLLGLVLSIGTSGSTEVWDHYWCFVLPSPTSSLLCYHFGYQARDYSTMGTYKMLVGHSMQITDGDEVMMYAGPSPPKGWGECWELRISFSALTAVYLPFFMPFR